MATQRPLSPHLQVYRPQLTSVLSIIHRMTGVWLCAGGVMLAAWVLAIAQGPQAYAAFTAFAGNWFGKLLFISFLFALYYHLCNGIRHLFWDAGRGYSIESVNRSGLAVLAVSVGATAGTCFALAQRLGVLA